MEDNSRRRRQNDQPMHATSSSRYQQTLQDTSQQRRSYAGSSSDRYRPAPLNTSSSTPGRNMGASAGYSGGYYQEPSGGAFSTTAMSQSTMGYHQPQGDYGQADARQTQGFAASTYNPTTAMMYNVQQAAGAQNPGSVYDTSQQYSSRQPAGLQMMTTDVAPSYFPTEPTNSATATSAALQQQAASASSSHAVYQQQPTLQTYSTGMSTLGGMATQQTSSTAAADVSMEDAEYPAAGGLDEAYGSYQTALKEIFRSIRSGILASAGESLLNVSDWLLSHVAELGLTSDDQSLHSDRIKLWNDFNHAWLAMFQRQKEMMESGRQLQRSQTLVSQENLENMGSELVRLCDAIERHGLVDYQYGVWEEQIIGIMEECLYLYSASDEATAASSSASRRR